MRRLPVAILKMARHKESGQVATVLRKHGTRKALDMFVVERVYSQAPHIKRCREQTKQTRETAVTSQLNKPRA
jgi:hypothetical protein